MSPTALEAIRRGALNVWANWQVVAVRIVGGLAVGVLALAGFLPLLFLIGFGAVRAIAGAGDPWEILESGQGAAGALLESALVPLVLTFLGMTAVWTVAFLVHCYFLGGAYGVLAAGEERAGADPGVSAAAFKSFDLGLFQRRAGELLWRFFWLLNIFFLGAGLLLLAVVPVAAVVYSLFSGGRELAAVGFGCLALPLFALALFAVSLWGQLSLAVAARRGAGVWAAIGEGLSLFGRRLGALALTVLLLIVSSVALSIAFMPLGVALDLGLADQWSAYVAGQIVVGLAQWVGSAALAAVFAAVLVALAGPRSVSA